MVQKRNHDLTSQRQDISLGENDLWILSDYAVCAKLSLISMCHICLQGEIPTLKKLQREAECQSFFLPRRCHAPRISLHCVSWHHTLILEVAAE